MAWSDPNEREHARSLKPSSFAPPTARLSSLPSTVQLAEHVQCGGTAEEYFDAYDMDAGRLLFEQARTPPTHWEYPEHHPCYYLSWFPDVEYTQRPWENDPFAKGGGVNMADRSKSLAANGRLEPSNPTVAPYEPNH